MNQSSPQSTTFRQRPTLRRRARGTEGMTLIEIMIVVVIMALIATAVGVAVLPSFKKSQVNNTKVSAQAIRSAVTGYIVENNDCPSNATQLREGGFLDSGKEVVDSWDNEFRIECDGDNIVVTSAGPDGQFGSEDDIQ